MSKELVAIIIPLYNSAKYIEKCVSSCQKQTHGNIEIIVIDDGSTDSGHTVVENLASHDQRVKLFRTENRGVSSARNLGIEKSSGNYVCFIDADDFIEPTFVETMLNAMLASRSDFCIAKNTWRDSRVFEENGEIVSAADAEKLLLSQKLPVGCWNKMYRRDLIKKTKFNKDLTYGEGFLFIIESASKAHRIITIDSGLYHYQKVNSDSATAKINLKKISDGEKSLSNIYEIIKNHQEVLAMWHQHRCLFYKNALLGSSIASLPPSKAAVWRQNYKDSYKQAYKSDLTKFQQLQLLAISYLPSLTIALIRLKRKLK